MNHRADRQFLVAVMLLLTGFTGMMVGAALGWPRIGETREPRTDFEQRCPVVAIVDGDTVDVEWRWRGPLDERIRLLNIDTPERGEPGYEKAARALKEMLQGKRVRLEFEKPGAPQRGKYGRLLVYVFTGDGTNINVELVRQGWSRYETDSGEGRYADEFRAAEAEARARRVGIWRLE